MSAIGVTTLGGMVAAIALSGCAAVNKTRPGDMTVAEHDQAARAELKQAEEATGRASVVGRGAASERISATRHRELAKEHAAASERRRADVAAVCEGVTNPTPFTSMKVQQVEAIREANIPRKYQTSRGYYPERLKGARVAVATPGADATAAVRSIACEAARESAGLAGEASTRSPFAIRSATAAATPASSGVMLIEIRSSNEGDAAEILHRAEALAGTPAIGR